MWGAAAAASTYFRKRPRELVVGEAALLAALLPAPEYRSPYKNPEVAVKARAEVLRRMAANGYISDETAEAEANAPLPSTLSVQPTNGRYVGGTYVPQVRPLRPVAPLLLLWASPPTAATWAAHTSCKCGRPPRPPRPLGRTRVVVSSLALFRPLFAPWYGN